MLVVQERRACSLNALALLLTLALPLTLTLPLTLALPLTLFSIMKITTDHPTLTHILLRVGVFSLLPSVKAASAECAMGWEWVQFSSFLVYRGLDA